MNPRLTLVTVNVFLSCLFGTTASAQDKLPLRIYFLDATRGAMTLIVTPLGESVLIDTGDSAAVHVERILLACEDANVVEIDHLVTTHFASEHIGGIRALSTRIPIRRFYDKGSRGADASASLLSAYDNVTLSKQVVVGAGDEIALAQDRTLYHLRLTCLASDRQIEGFEGDINAPVEDFTMMPGDDSEKGSSLVFLLTYGSFSFFTGGDITWNLEHHLVHPENRVGQVDLYAVSNHGLDVSNNPLLLQSIEPTVCVASNGESLGIMPSVFSDLLALPSLETLFQLHYNLQFGDSGNTDSIYIANRQGETGHWVKASAYPEKEIFEIELSRPGAILTYPIMPRPGVVPPPSPPPGGRAR